MYAEFHDGIFSAYAREDRLPLMFSDRKIEIKFGAVLQAKRIDSARQMPDEFLGLFRRQHARTYAKHLLELAVAHPRIARSDNDYGRAVLAFERKSFAYSVHVNIKSQRRALGCYVRILEIYYPLLHAFAAEELPASFLCFVHVCIIAKNCEVRGARSLKSFVMFMITQQG